MKGVGAFVIIKPKDGALRTTKSGLEVPTAMSDRFLQAELISASEEIGKKEFGLEAGQEILYDKHAGHDVPNAKGETYRIITCRDVAVIL
jgi:co-chaperonin GroES (HSP10)|tara:strand:+ start:64405 stop:64674 length:270 start_codon:yes stop_codon:yes gene_type:complete